MDNLYILVGGFKSSEKYESQLGWWFPIYWENKKCSKPPTSDSIYNLHVDIYVSTCLKNIKQPSGNLRYQSEMPFFLEPNAWRSHLADDSRVCRFLLKSYASKHGEGGHVARSVDIPSRDWTRLFAPHPPAVVTTRACTVLGVRLEELDVPKKWWVVYNQNPGLRKLIGSSIKLPT